MEDARPMSKFMMDWKDKQEKSYEEALSNWCEKNGKQMLSRHDEKRTQLENEYQEYLNSEMERKKEEEQKQAESEKQYRIEKAVAEFEKRVPPRYKGANLSQLKMSEQTKMILDGASAVIVGGNGFGKTHLFYALGREWVSRGETVEIITAQELLYNIKANDNGLYDYIKGKYRNSVQHLLIDEIDKIFESKADHIYLNYLVNMRYEWLLQTIFIGNGTVDDLKKGVGNSVVDRLTKEGGVSIDCSKSDRDWRLQDKEN